MAGYVDGRAYNARELRNSDEPGKWGGFNESRGKTRGFLPQSMIQRGNTRMRELGNEAVQARTKLRPSVRDAISTLGRGASRDDPRAAGVPASRLQQGGYRQGSPHSDRRPPSAQEPRSPRSAMRPATALGARNGVTYGPPLGATGVAAAAPSTVVDNVEFDFGAPQVEYVGAEPAASVAAPFWLNPMTHPPAPVDRQRPESEPLDLTQSPELRGIPGYTLDADVDAAPIAPTAVTADDILDEELVGTEPTGRAVYANADGTEFSDRTFEDSIRSAMTLPVAPNQDDLYNMDPADMTAGQLREFYLGDTEAEQAALDQARWGMSLGLEGAAEQYEALMEAQAAREASLGEAINAILVGEGYTDQARIQAEAAAEEARLAREAAQPLQDLEMEQIRVQMEGDAEDRELAAKDRALKSHQADIDELTAHLVDLGVPEEVKPIYDRFIRDMAYDGKTPIPLDVNTAKELLTYQVGLDLSQTPRTFFGGSVAAGMKDLDDARYAGDAPRIEQGMYQPTSIRSSLNPFTVQRQNIAGLLGDTTYTFSDADGNVRMLPEDAPLALRREFEALAKRLGSDAAAAEVFYDRYGELPPL